MPVRCSVDPTSRHACVACTSFASNALLTAVLRDTALDRAKAVMKSRSKQLKLASTPLSDSHLSTVQQLAQVYHGELEVMLYKHMLERAPDLYTMENCMYSDEACARRIIQNEIGQPITILQRKYALRHPSRWHRIVKQLQLMWVQRTDNDLQISTTKQILLGSEYGSQVKVRVLTLSPPTLQANAATSPPLAFS